MKEFKDFTGDYEKVDPNLEQLLKIKLTDDYTFKLEPSVTHGGRLTTFVSNRFLTVADGQLSRTDLIVEGDVEQIQYGRPQNIQANIATYHLWGALGSAIRGAIGEDIRVALIEYRVKVLDSEKREIAVFLIQGTFRANAKRMSREEIINYANKVAAEQLAWELNTTIAKEIGLERRSHHLPGEQTEAYPSALWDETSE